MIVLDTHAWVWWIGQPDQLSDRARGAVDRAAAQGQVYVSSISVSEVALLVERNRLRLTMDLDAWLDHCQALPFLRFVPVNNRIALQSVRSGCPHRCTPIRRIVSSQQPPSPWAPVW